MEKLANTFSFGCLSLVEVVSLSAYVRHLADLTLYVGLIEVAGQTVGHSFIHVLVRSVSNVFQISASHMQEVSNAHRQNYSGHERTDSRVMSAACIVKYEPTVAIKSNRHHE
jgi:hypothetical protein